MVNAKTQLTKLQTKAKVQKERSDAPKPWWKKPWVWIVSAVGALLLILGVMWLKSKLSADQEELAKLRTKVEHDRIKAKNIEHQAKLESNDEKAAAYRAEAMLMRAKANREMENIAAQERENAKALAGLDLIKSWDELDAINLSDRT